MQGTRALVQQMNNTGKKMKKKMFKFAHRIKLEGKGEMIAHVHLKTSLINLGGKTLNEYY